MLKDTLYWSRKIHIHLGLFLLLFIWLFSFSGLLLNHGEWAISSFWEQRKETKTTKTIQIPSSRDSSTVITSILSQLDLKGEVSNVKQWPDSLHFRVAIPGLIKTLKVDYGKAVCIEEQLAFNTAGVIRTLHTFNGVDKGKPESSPNWAITSIWRFSMDAIAIGLLLLCISSWIMWYKVRKKYRLSWLALAFGFVGACYFVFVLTLL